MLEAVNENILFTLSLLPVPCELETFSHYSYLIANISHNQHDHRLPSNYHCETTPSYEQEHRVPKESVRYLL